MAYGMRGERGGGSVRGVLRTARSGCGVCRCRHRAGWQPCGYAWTDDGVGAHAGDLFAQALAVIGFVGQHRFGSLAFEQTGGRGNVAGLARRDAEPQRSAERVGDHLDLGRQSTSGTPQRLIHAPFSGRCLLGGADDHQILIVPVKRQRPAHPSPDAGMVPAGTPMHGLPLAVAFWQIVPVRT